MPHTYVRDDVRRRLTVTVSGPLTMDVVFSILDHQAGEGIWAYGVLHDLSRTTGGVDASAIRALVERVRRLSVLHGPRGPVALVTSELAQLPTPTTATRTLPLPFFMESLRFSFSP